MSVTQTSREAFEKLGSKLIGHQSAVFEALADIGPAHNARILEYLNQKAKVNRREPTWQINQITGRVRELVDYHNIVEELGTFEGLWHGTKKRYDFRRVRGDMREPAGWVKVARKKKPVPLPQASKVSSDLRRQIEQSYARRYEAGEAGRRLVECRQDRRHGKRPSNQLTLF